MAGGQSTAVTATSAQAKGKDGESAASAQTKGKKAYKALLQGKQPVLNFKALKEAAVARPCGLLFLLLAKACIHQVVETLIGINTAVSKRKKHSTEPWKEVDEKYATAQAAADKALFQHKSVLAALFLLHLARVRGTMLNLRYSDYKERGWQYWSDPALEVLEAEADAGDFERIQGGSPQERILPKCIQVLKMLRDMEKGPEPTRTSGAHAYLDAFKDSPLLGESKRKRIKAHLAEMAPMREKILREEAMMAKAPDDPEEAGVKASAEDRERRSNKAKEAKSQKEAEQAMAYLQAQLAAAGPQGDVKRAERLRELTHLTWGEIKAAAAPAEMPGVLLEWLADPAGKPWLVYQTALLPGTIYGSATKLLLDLVDAILDEPPMSPRQVPNALVKKIVDMQVSPEHRAQLLRQLFAKPVCCWPHDIPSAQQLFRKNPSDFELLLPEGHWKEWRAVMEHAMHWEHEQPEDRKHICSIDNIMISVCDTELPTATTQTMRTVHDYAMAHVMERLTVVCMCNKGIGQEWWVDCGRHSSSQPVLRRGCPEDDPAVREAYANLMVRGALLLWMHQEWSHPEERAPPDCVQRIHTALQAKEITWEGLGPELQQLYVARHAQEPLTAAFIWNPLAASAAPDLDDRSTPRSYETDAGSLTPDSAEHAEHAAHELAADDPAMDSRPLLQEPDLIDLPALRARLQAGNGCASEEPSPTSWGTASYSPDDFDSLALPGVGLQDDDLRSLPSGPSSSSGGRQGDPYDAAGLKPRGVLGPPTDFIGHLHQRAREYILPLEGVQDLQRRLETLRLGQKILLLQRAQQKHMKRPLIETILTILRMLAADGCLTTPLMNAIGRYIFEGLNATSEDFHPPYDISLCDLRLLTLDELAALMEQLLVVVGLHQDSLSWYQTVQNATDLSYRPYKTLGPEGLQLSQQGQAMLAFPPLPVSHDAFHILLSRAASDDAEAQKDSVPACFDATPGWDDTLADEACEREITSCIVGGTLPRWNPGPEASTSGRIDGIGDGVAMEDVADCIQHLVEQALTARVLHHLGQQALLELLRAWQDLRSCEVVPYEGTNSWFQGMFEAYQRLYVGLTDLYEWRLKVRGVEAGNCAQQLLPFHTACQERIKASQRKAEECHQKIKVLDARDAVRAEDLLDEAQRHQNEANQNTHECVRRKFQHASKIHHDATHYLEQYGQGSLPDDFLRDSNGQVDPMLRWLQTCFGQRHTQYSDADVQQVLKKLPNPLFQCEVLHRAEEALGDGMEELDALALQLERLLVPARGLAWKLVVGCREDLSATLMGPIHRALVKKLQDAAVAEQAKQAETAAAELLAASAAEDARAQKAAAAKAAKGKKKSKPHAEDARAQEDAERAAREAAEEAAQQEEEERDREAERLRAEEADAKQHEYDALLVKRAEAAHNHARAAQDQAWKQNLWPDNNGVHLEDVGKEEEFETQRARRARSKQAGASAAAEAGPPAEPPRDSSPFRSDCHRCGKVGHRARDCPQAKAEKAARRGAQPGAGRPKQQRLDVDASAFGDVPSSPVKAAAGRGSKRSTRKAKRSAGSAHEPSASAGDDFGIPAGGDWDDVDVTEGRCGAADEPNRHPQQLPPGHGIYGTSQQLPGSQQLPAGFFDPYSPSRPSPIASAAANGKLPPAFQPAGHAGPAAQLRSNPAVGSALWPRAQQSAIADHHMQAPGSPGSPSRRPQPAGRAGRVPAYMRPEAAQQGQAGSYRPGPACYQPLGAAATPTDEEFNKLMNILSSESAASNPAVVGARERSGGAVAQWGGQPAMPVAPGGNKQEDEELQAAIKASLTESQKPRAPTLGKLTVRTQDGPPRQRPLSPEVATPGLQNAAGEYNCFLNVIIQCLWHCTDFRERLMCWGPELVQANPVVAALVGLFHAFAEEESQRHDAARLPDRKRQIVAPTALRAALSALPAQAFRMGEMNDPSEVLLAVYEALKQVRDPHTGAPIGQTLVDGVFGLHVSESVLCRACRKRTQQSGYTQFFYTASATALRMQQIAMPEDRVFGRLLRSIEDNHLKSCDTDVGGCNTSNTVSHELQQPPRVFTLQLAWESQHESGADILATLQTIQEVVDLSTVYAGLPPTAYLYRLHSMVCYYGAHYHAFVQSSKSGQWLMFDDATINVVGSWKDVVSKCQLGKIQPSVLFFTALNT